MFPGFRQCHIMTYMGKPLIIEEPLEEEKEDDKYCPFPQIRCTEVLFMDEWGIDGINMLCGIANAFDNGRIEICGRGDDGDAEENDWDNYVYANSWDWMKHTRYYFHFCPECLETSVAWSNEPAVCGWCGSRQVSFIAPATRNDYAYQMIANKWWGDERAEYFYDITEVREAHLADCPPKPMSPEERKWIDEHCVPWEQVRKELGLDDDDDE